MPHLMGEDRAPAGYRAALHWYAVATACATFLLIIAGALVTSQDAGLSVPDWPLSYGKLMPPMPARLLPTAVPATSKWTLTAEIPARSP